MNTNKNRNKNYTIPYLNHLNDNHSYFYSYLDLHPGKQSIHNMTTNKHDNI